MSEKIISDTLEVVTKEVAEKWLNDYPYSRQRGLKAKQLTRLVKAMETGTFKQGTQVHLVFLGEQGHLVNGQHTLTAISISEKPQQLSVLRTEVDSEEALNHLYAVEDRQAPRTTGDVLKAYNLSEEFGLSVGSLRTALSAIRFIEGGFFGSVQNRVLLNDVETIELLRKYKVAIQKFQKAIAGSSGSIRVGLQRSSTQSIGLAILMSDKAKEAVDFFQAIATDEHDEAEPVIRKMQQHMVDSYMPTGRATHRATMIPPSYAARIVAAGWNAFVDESEFVMPERYTMAEPIDIHHTEFVNPNAPY